MYVSMSKKNVKHFVCIHLFFSKIKKQKRIFSVFLHTELTDWNPHALSIADPILITLDLRCLAYILSGSYMNEQQTQITITTNTKKI